MTEEPCEMCKVNQQEYITLLEKNEPSDPGSLAVCGECLEKVKSYLIDSWTLAEWRSL